MFLRSLFTHAGAVTVCVMLICSVTAHAEAPLDKTNAVISGSETNESTRATGLIVKFFTDKSPTPQSANARSNRIASAIADHPRRPNTVQFARSLATGAELHRFDAAVSIRDAETMAHAVTRMAGVEYAAPNRVISTMTIPTDPEFPSQWGFRYSPGSIEGANFTAAWDITKGSAAQTLGVVDSGIAAAHEGFAGRIRTSASFPNGGYDFITDATNSGDGDGRDNNPEQAPDSCVHGAHVAGTMVANTTFSGTGVGVAGGAPQSLVLAARALNTFGDDADAIDAMLWLGGLSAVNGETNSFRVRAINMSFGGAGACGGAYQNAFDQLFANGTLPIVAAGNSSNEVSGSAPANCRGAIAVAANDILGNLASFSNYGAGITLTAPGVDIISINGAGGSCSKSGTSMSAPHVTAAIGLMQTANPSLTNSQTVLGLRAGARAFPALSNCTSALCGAGLLDAYGAIQATQASTTARVGWSNGAPISVRENEGSVSLSLTRIGATSAATNATVNVLNGTAINGTDFSTPSTITVGWGANDVSDKTINIPITSRSGEQGTRNFSLQLASFSGGGGIVSPNAVDVRITEVDCTTVTPIAFGETKSGNLGVVPNVYCRGGVRGPEFNTVRYSFAGIAGGYASIALNSTQPAIATVLDTYVYLLDSNLQIVAENDDVQSGVNRNSRIVNFLIPSSGTYYIDVTAWSSTQENSGTYTIKLSSCGLTYDAGPTCNLDVDGDLSFDARDAQMTLRRILGYDATATINGLNPFSVCALRTTAATINSFIDTQISRAIGAKPYDLDGDGVVLAATDGLMILRAALGLPGASIVAGAVAPTAPRNTWALIQPYLKNECGLTIAP
jgi:serine protease